MPGALSISLRFVVFAVGIGRCLADSTDWVNPSYVLGTRSSSVNAKTAAARNAIISGAGTTAKDGPWSVTDSKDVTAPSGDPHDYLSWAPYHWPDCHWCPKGKAHYSAPNTTWSPDSPDGDTDADPDDGAGDETGSNPEEADGDAEDEFVEEILEGLREVNASILQGQARSLAGPASHHRMRRAKRTLSTNMHALRAHHLTPLGDAAGDATVSTSSSVTENMSNDTSSEPVQPEGVQDNQTLEHAAGGTSDNISMPTPTSGSPQPGFEATVTSVPDTEAAAKKSSAKGSPKKASPKSKKAASSSCTPSPTKSLPPSATWTTCPYVEKDGKVNPDTRSLVGPPDINNVSQSVLYNAIAYALKRTASYSHTAASFIDTFFLAASTKMNPNMQYGQLVRGPGPDGRIGTFTGMLDLRGMVKVTNAIFVLKAAKSPDWTSARDQGMKAWTSEYVKWILNSPLAQKTATRPNNHATFYVSQLAALKMLMGDSTGSSTVLQDFFGSTFKDQIAASGEQPFEAVRTRPYHYRCFNLEALITNAKLGDQLGLNLWMSTSKYGATIQKALDYTMSLDPKDEDVTEIVPHVAAVAAAYGDPSGKYAKFMARAMSNYQSKAFWFYDQTAALENSPAGVASHKRAMALVDDPNTNKTTVQVVPDSVSGNATQTMPSTKFVCPDVFMTLGPSVEISDGVFVSCDDLRPFYVDPQPSPMLP